MKQKKKFKVEFSGFALGEFVKAVAEINAREEYRKWQKDTELVVAHFSDAERPFVCLWSDDIGWIRCMRRILGHLPIIEGMRNGYGLPVNVVEMSPEPPADNPASGVLWQSIVLNLFPFKFSAG